MKKYSIRFTFYRTLTASLFGFLAISAASEVLAGTYYVDGTSGNDISGDGSGSLPWKTIKKGVAPLGPGDTLVIRDGVYSGEANNICGPYGGYDQMPSGSSGNYITIKSENYLGAVIDGGNQYQPVFLWQNASWLIFENLFFRNCGSNNGGANFRAQDCHHIKVLNCASEESYFGHFWFYNSKYCLLEDCAAWGRSAYSYVFVGEYDDYTRSQYNIARRCLARRDVHYYPDHQANHFASFVAYWADHTYFQNCISLDGIHVEDESNVTDDDWIATTVFFTTNGASNYCANGCIALNDVGQIASCSPGDRQTILFNNNAVWMNDASTFGLLAVSSNADYYAINNLLANVRGIGDYQGAGIVETEGRFKDLRNNILWHNRIGMDRVLGSHSYNLLYNDQDYSGTGTGTGEVTGMNPQNNGLSYLPRIEAGSVLKTLGKSGSQMGAQIEYRIGPTGTLYGETGWNLDTETLLWPWPNESVIQSKMASYGAHGVNGARGFCAGGTGLYGGPVTLTTYIWEALGRPCPGEIFSLPVPDIKANGLDAPLTLSAGDMVSVSASLNPGSFSNQNADWWVAKDGPDGWYYYDVLGGSWSFQPGLSLTYQGPLFELGSTDIWVGAELSSGTHTFYFGVDRVMDGILTYEALTYDSISITVGE
jgi:hypothetical protein